VPQQLEMDKMQFESRPHDDDVGAPKGTHVPRPPSLQLAEPKV